MTDLETEFTQLIHKYESTIYSACMMFANSPDETDDFVQEALIKLWQGLRVTDKVCKSWIWRVTINSCITIGRKRKKRRDECPMTANIEDIMNACDSGGRNTNVRMLYDRIHQLNIFDRAIVMLWLEGMPYDEIGEIIGITTKNVSVRLIRIKELLKKMNNGKEQ